LPIRCLSTFCLPALALVSVLAWPAAPALAFLSRRNRFRPIAALGATPHAGLATACVANGAEQFPTRVTSLGDVDSSFGFQLVAHFDGQDHASSLF
jgi:hypothetical protein